MTAASSDVAATARRAKRSRSLELLTRVGFVGFGVTHLLVAWLAIQIAFGRTPASGDQYGAFQIVAGQPFGKWLLIVVAVGLVAMAIWQALEAAVGHRGDRGKERIAERIASVGRFGFYTFLAYTAYKVISGSGKTSTGQQQQAASSILDEAGGRWLIGLIGVAVLAVSVGLIWYGLVKRFEKHLKSGEMPADVHKTVRWLGVFGYAAKGVAYGTLGVLLIGAAATHDPGKSRGLDAALRTLVDRSWGDVLLLVVAAGIGAYGLFALAQARYRKV
jgi:hypothetical protein